MHDRIDRQHLDSVITARKEWDRLTPEIKRLIATTKLRLTLITFQPFTSYREPWWLRALWWFGVVLACIAMPLNSFVGYTSTRWEVSLFHLLLVVLNACNFADMMLTRHQDKEEPGAERC